MTGDVIKSFLVGLGFGVDESSLNKFNKSIAEASVKVTALAAAITGTATAVGLGITSISENFEQIGYEYRIIAPMISRALLLRRELLKAYAAAGLNITKVVLQSVKLNFSLNKTKFAFQAIYQSVAAKFFPLLTKQSDLLRKRIYENLPRIQAVLEKFVNFIFTAFNGLVQLGTRAWSILGRIYDFFVQLHKATNGWSTIILGAIAAWKALNLSFLATPIGQILALGAALLALYDDFETFEEGGKSLFDWTDAIPVIDAVKATIKSLTGALVDLWDLVKSLGQVWNTFFGRDNGAFFDAVSHSVHNLDKVMTDLGSTIEHGVDGIDKLATFTGNYLTNTGALANAVSNLQSNPISNPGFSTPNGPQQIQNSQSSQTLNQQTNITVQGSADAQSTAKAVSTEQYNVNRDHVRNMKGATR